MAVIIYHFRVTKITDTPLSRCQANYWPCLLLQVRTVNAEINIPAPQPGSEEEPVVEDEDEVYTRGSPTVVTVDGTVTVPSGDGSGSLQKHSHSTSDQSAPATNV